MKDLIESILTITDDPRRDYRSDDDVEKKLFELLTKQLHKPIVMESVLPLLRECVMRSNLALPENEQDLKWFDETCSVKNSGDFYERLHAALELGGKTAP